MARWLLLAALLLAVATVYFSTRGDDAHAAGPCGTSHDAMSAEEQEFLGLLQQWRASSGVSNEPVEVSGALNQAAAWFAEWQVTNNALGGHNDSYGRNWVGRAIDCGYTAKLTNGQYWASGSGEGVYAAATNGDTVGPQAALNGMISHPGSGIYMYGSPPSFPAKCYGVGVYRSGGRVAWVVVIAQLPASLGCPGGSGGGTIAPPSPSSSPTNTPTVTPTATPTQKPVFYSWFSQVAKD